MNKSSKQPVFLLFLIFILCLFLSKLPLAGIILYPISLFSTFIHEFGHAFAAIISGGKVLYIKVFLNCNGVTGTSGGNSFLITQGGYFANTIIGTILLVLAATKSSKIPRITLTSITAILIVTVALFIKDFVTIIIVVFFIAILLYVIIKGSDFVCRLFLNFLAIQCIFYIFSNIVSLLNISFLVFEKNDLTAMQNMTFIPAPIWALIWSIASITMFSLAVYYINKTN